MKDVSPDPAGAISAASLGFLDDGWEVCAFTLANAGGMVVVLSAWGATLAELQAPDRDGRLADVTLGYDTLAGWVGDTSYMNATAGRYGNRIARGRFTLDGTGYTLATNNGENHLHGGAAGFNKRLWDAEPFERATERGVVFRYTSPDGEEGYPGELSAEVAYTLTDGHALRLDFRTTTRPTPVNLVHHTYWNLSGDPAQTVLDHALTLHADRYCPIDASGIPLGGLEGVAGTPFDFTTPHAVCERIEADHPQLANGLGYDHSWAVRGDAGTLRPAAELYDPASGRVMTIETDQPAIQFYSGNYLDGVPGKGGRPMPYRSGLCLETQCFPDTPNQPALGDATLRPGETYRHTMVHRFGTR
jgi:aldose 1-epimerase